MFLITKYLLWLNPPETHKTVVITQNLTLKTMMRIIDTSNRKEVDYKTRLEVEELD